MELVMSDGVTGLKENETKQSVKMGCIRRIQELVTDIASYLCILPGYG